MNIKDKNIIKIAVGIISVIYIIIMLNGWGIVNFPYQVTFIIAVIGIFIVPLAILKFIRQY